MKKMFTLVCIVMVVTLLAGTTARAEIPVKPMEKAIVDTLALLPHYGVFDSLSFQLDGNSVILLGQVMLPITKDEAGKRVAKISGVGNVINRLEVLPLSPGDDRIRLAVYRRLFSTADLYRYALGARPSIHIIVKDGHLSLEGVVSTESDSNLALMAAKQVTGIFSVKNNLRIEK